MKKIQGWHFCKDWKLRDGQKVEVGKTYSVKGELIMCQHGLHLSERIIDALNYAPGNIICRVEGWGDMQKDSDKIICRYRTVLAAIDGEKLLHEAACYFAETALTVAKIKDERCWNAFKVKRLWLKGKVTDEELAAARDAAWAVAWAAASDAAWAAAWAAARAAAWAAASDAAWAAAWAAASDAASAAAWAAARAAAWAAARDAASAKFNKYLTRKVKLAMAKQSTGGK